MCVRVCVVSLCGVCVCVSMCVDHIETHDFPFVMSAVDRGEKRRTESHTLLQTPSTSSATRTHNNLH